MDRSILAFRSRCIREIRYFFEETGYLEVDTPILAKKIIPEPTLDLLQTVVHRAEGEGGATMVLLPSPEIYMKRLLAAASGSIFQFSRCFRDYEPASRLHNHEFLMLEWYTMEADYIDSLDMTEALLARICERCEVPEPLLRSVSPPFERITIDEAFEEYAEIDLKACDETGSLARAAGRLGIVAGESDDWNELFHLILVTHIEPNLKKDRPVVLLDYPARVGCLAKLKGNRRERWELYLNGIELANCFSEAVSPPEVAEYFEREGAQLESAGRGAQTDLSFPDLYDGTHPPCSGVAMGIDRLIMALAGAQSIQEVMPFGDGTMGSGR